VLKQLLREDRNYKLGVGNGWLVYCADGFMNPAVVMAAFASKLDAPAAIIGLLPAIAAGGWMLPQIIVASFLPSQARKIQTYRSTAWVRTGAHIVMVASSALLIQHPVWLLVCFITAMMINSLASGVSGLPFLEVVSKVVPAEKRNNFFAVRNLFGGVLAFFSGLAVGKILDSPLEFPYDYTLIFGIGTILFNLAWTMFGWIDEPPDEVKPKADWLSEVRNIPQTLRADPFLRAFLGVRLWLAFAAMCEPFYAVYALKELHMPRSMIGVFIMTITIVAPLSNLLWARVGNLKDSRRVIRLSSVLALSAPLLALSLPAGSLYSYLWVFALSSVANQGFNLAHTNHLLNLAPEHSRSRYIGVINTLVGIALFAPVLGGLLADSGGYRVTFILSSVLFVLAWWRVGTLKREA
jgi:hypothetical protein